MNACPECKAAVHLRSTVVDIRSLKNPPRQVGPFIKLTYWQCDKVRDHHGEASREPYEPSVEQGSASDGT